MAKGSWKGSCLCGVVKFSVKEASNMTHCHCSMCRKIHGSLFATYFAATDLHYHEGENAIAHFESSPGFARSLDKPMCMYQQA